MPLVQFFFFHNARNTGSGFTAAEERCWNNSKCILSITHLFHPPFKYNPNGEGLAFSFCSQVTQLKWAIF